MERLQVAQRNNWQASLESKGMNYHTHDDGSLYWNEGVYYSFKKKEIEAIEKATNELQALCIVAVQHILNNKEKYQDHFNIDPSLWSSIEKSWDEDEVSIYGRFDFAFLPSKNIFSSPVIKMLEYNADTPTSLIEAAIAQWFWLQDVFPKKDQFNSIHERLIEAWKRYGSLSPDVKHGLPITFVAQDTAEDWQTISYLRDTAVQANILTNQCLVDDMAWDGKIFINDKEEPIYTCFKLYPWEFMTSDDFGVYLTKRSTTFIEPMWKMLLSNKALLPVLWELNPGHPNLLPSFFQGTFHELKNYVIKPALAREGADVKIYRNAVLEVEGQEQGYQGKSVNIIQELVDLEEFDGNYPIIGSWVVDGESAGMGIREASTKITDNKSRFVPHCIG